jgi:hydrogenase expression/formation protein HypE
MAHGGGGRQMNTLVENVFRHAFADEALDAQHDGAVLNVPEGRLAVTTDSYVVHPLTFPGGTIGTLAVNGSVNDLAMCGARPLYLTAGFVLEEGLPFDDLIHIVESMGRAAREARIRVVTGDTKVVDRGKGDGMFISTAGIGVCEHQLVIDPRSVAPGDAVILSGDIGRHGMAVMAVREGLEFETAIESDCAPVADVVMALIAEGIEIHCLRDLTRGGLASALVEIAETSDRYIAVDESVIPVESQVAAACEILGLDPMYVANEGRFVCFCPAGDADDAIRVLKRFPVTLGAVQIGTVEAGSGLVTMRSRIGVNRVVDLLSGEQLPRIC